MDVTTCRGAWMHSAASCRDMLVAEAATKASRIALGGIGWPLYLPPLKRDRYSDHAVRLQLVRQEGNPKNLVKEASEYSNLMAGIFLSTRSILCLEFSIKKGAPKTVMGTQNREPQEYSRNMIGNYLPSSSYSCHLLAVPDLGTPIHWLHLGSS